MTDIDFNDYDPEDAYDVGDPVEVRLDVLERVVDSLRGPRTDRFDGRAHEALRVIRNFAAEDLSRRDRRRLTNIREDLEGL